MPPVLTGPQWLESFPWLTHQNDDHKVQQHFIAIWANVGISELENPFKTAKAQKKNNYRNQQPTSSNPIQTPKRLDYSPAMATKCFEVQTQALTGASMASSCWARLWTAIGGTKSCSAPRHVNFPIQISSCLRLIFFAWAQLHLDQTVPRVLLNTNTKIWQKKNMKTL